MFRGWHQLKCVLWKNWLLKRAHMASFLAELLLPVAFMAILIGIKQITTIYNSPNIAYYCGNTYPWFSSSSAPSTVDELLQQPPYVCTQRPDNCSLSNYYKDGYSLTNPVTDTTYKIFRQYGFMQSGSTSGQSDNPFYAFNIGDNTSVYQSNWFDLDNPSLPFCDIMERLKKNRVLLGLAPKESTDSVLVSQVDQFRSFLIKYCLTNANYSSSIVQFTTEDDLEDYITDRDYDDKGYKQGKIAMAIVFIKSNISSVQWEYAIRANYTSQFDTDQKSVSCLYGDDCDYVYGIPSTKFKTDDLTKPQSTEYLFGYTYSGFSTLQLMVDEYIMSFYGVRNDANSTIKASVGFMPTEDFKSDNFQYVISSTLGIFYMLSFLYPVSRIIRSLVLEKELRIKEGMKMMGLTDLVYNSSWLITTLLQMTVVSILITAITSTTVFQYSNKFLIFLYFEAFSVAIINMCFLLSACFSRSKTASLLGPMIFFATFFPYYAVNDPQFDTGSKTATCLLAPACFGLGATVIADYEGGLVGVQKDNTTEETSNFTYAACVIMMFVDAVIYGILAWYVDKVLPSEFGTALPWYFFMSPSYWCGCKLTSKRRDRSLLGRIMACFGYNTEHNHVPLEAHGVQQNALLEPVSSDLLQQKKEEMCVSIEGLRRVFKNKAGGADKVAVEGLDLDLFQGQVTVLLGHNGAGKSTTISMLVGLIPPSAGDATMPGGLLLSEDMARIRNMLGVCPQHDILFPELTPMQHLMMFAAFKGVSSWEVEKAARNMLSEINLAEKANAPAGSLSGGQKRKLSLGMALIGDSKVIVLDEPTSGMDPYSRRSTWSIIQRHKKGRVILLTTHFMDEADILGDRIAIMSNGGLVCCGSSLFLKNKYGVGYTLTIVKSMTQSSGQQARDNASEAIEKVVTSFISEAEPLSDIGAELSMRLPFAASSRFVDLFHALDNDKRNLGVAEYGISVTTLEEVFIRVGHDTQAGGPSAEDHPHTEDNLVKDHANPTTDGDTNGNGKDIVPSTQANNRRSVVQSILSCFLPHLRSDQIYPVCCADNATPPVDEFHDKDASEYGKDLFFTHFSALLIKRFIYAKRDQRMLICQLVLPIILVVIGLSILLIKPNLNQPDYVLSPSSFNGGFSSRERNYVPFNVEEGCGQICYDIRERFNGNSNDGVYGVYVPVNTTDALSQPDAFGGCAVGADFLYNTSQYLLKSPDSDLGREDGSTRYGAISLGKLTSSTLLNYNTLVNGSAMHGLGIYMNLIHQAYLQTVTSTPTAKIVAHNHPLPVTFKQQSQSATASAFVVSLFVMIAVCFIPTSFAVFVVKEREVKAKHQQIISGVSIYAYWITTYLFDVVSYLPTGLLIMAMCAAYGIDAFVKGQGPGALILALILYGPSTASLTYILSFLFKSHSTAQVSIMFFNFITGLCLMIVSFILTAIPSTQAVNVQLRYFFRLFPSFCLGDCFILLSLCTDGKECPNVGSNGYDYSNTVSPWHWNIVGGDLTYMAAESVFYFLITILIEISLSYPAIVAKLNPVNDPGLHYEHMLAHEDEDVRAERERVLNNPESLNDIIRIEQLRKVYSSNGNFFTLGLTVFSNLMKLLWRSCFGSSSARDVPGAQPIPNQDNGVAPAPQVQHHEAPAGVKVAVKCLTFGIPKGECFGFLGINGAGKTTTLSILSGEQNPTAGTALINNFDIITQQPQIRRLIGYCPQFDALFELLTVEEHLRLYARIKGLSKLGAAQFDEAVLRKMTELNLMSYRDKLAGSLSGGNKRKLSVAIATIADPPIVFLDEPSSGMDPVARRFMWKVIARMSTLESRCSVILTTHSMEEAEALCTRIGVMVNGGMQCLGSAQHLKHRFGQGYEVNLKLQDPPEAAVEEILLRLRSAGFFQLRISSPRADVENGERGMTEWEHHRITRSMLPAIAQALGNTQRLAGIETNVQISTNALQDTGANSAVLLLEGLLRTEGNTSRPVDALAAAANSSISALQFAEFWLLEDRFATLTAFLQKEFGERAVLIERNSSQSCRYRVLRLQGMDEDYNDLADIFAKFEANKEALCIHEYSVGQTTLEQIFNQFAAKQHDPDDD